MSEPMKLPLHDPRFCAFQVSFSPDLSMMYLMPPLNTKYTLETFNVMSLQGFYMAAIERPALTSIEEDRKTNGMVNGDWWRL